MDGQPGAVAEGQRVEAGRAGVVEFAQGPERAGVEDEVVGVVGPLLFGYGSAEDERGVHVRAVLRDVDQWAGVSDASVKDGFVGGSGPPCPVGRVHGAALTSATRLTAE
ncbi:hypothetical protein [Streptomyces sp. NPDC102409]|uniref:hypothetical protein n=1 Tax=Streptomyces sp. NPDC102409 TaxID=3366172 RepID=UPI0038247D5A